MTKNGLDHPRVGTKIRQLIPQGVAAAMQSQPRRDPPIPLKPQDESPKRFCATQLRLTGAHKHW